MKIIKVNGSVKFGITEKTKVRNDNKSVFLEEEYIKEGKLVKGTVEIMKEKIDFIEDVEEVEEEKKEEVEEEKKEEVEEEKKEEV